MFCSTDADIGNNAKVKYSLSGVDASNFAIDAHDGTIRTRVSFDREKRESYIVTVQAQDSGTSPLSGSTTVSIRILDVNDNAPAFTKSVYRATVPENEPIGREITSVSATDDDKGQSCLFEVFTWSFLFWFSSPILCVRVFVCVCVCVCFRS